jgi:hypothetical protein
VRTQAGGCVDLKTAGTALLPAGDMAPLKDDDLRRRSFIPEIPIKFCGAGYRPSHGTPLRDLYEIVLDADGATGAGFVVKQVL